MSSSKGVNNREDTDPKDTINTIFNMASRIDERVKILSERQKEIDAQAQRIMGDIQKLQEKVAIISSENPHEHILELRNKAHMLESQVEKLQTRMEHHDNRWGQIFDSIWKLTLMVIAGYILYKLGLQSPPD